MAENTTITNHDEIRSWIENHDGSPALNEIDLSGGTLAINFGDVKEFEPLSWDEFFDHFESLGLAFQHSGVTAEGDEFSYGFVDRHITQDGRSEDDESGTEFPASDVPRENVNPSASPQDTDPDNIDDGFSNGSTVDDVFEQDTL